MLVETVSNEHDGHAYNKASTKLNGLHTKLPKSLYSSSTEEEMNIALTLSKKIPCRVKQCKTGERL